MKPSVSHLQAIGFALVSYTFWVFTDAGMKISGEAGLPPYELMGLMGFSATVVVSLVTVASGNIQKLRPRNIGQQAFCALCSIACTLCNAVALKHLPLTIFYIVVFTAPMLTAILAALFLQEKLSPAKIVAIVAGFAGVVIAVNPFGAGEGDWIGYAAGTASVIAYASWTVRMRTMAQSESLESIAFFSGLCMTGLGLVWTLPDFQSVAWFGVGIALFSGLLNLGGNLSNYKALRHTTATNVLQIHYTQIVTGAVLAYFIWHEIPTWHLATGAVVIIASGLYIAAQARKVKNFPGVSPP